MSIEKVLEAFKQNNPGNDGQIIEVCHDFFVKSLQMHKCQNSKEPLENAEQAALNAIENKAGAKFIAA